MENTILSVKDLHVNFRTFGGTVQAVRGVSFDLQKGETLAIVGESGSGKSVSTKAVLGILPKNGKIAGGQILYNGDDMARYKEKDFAQIRGKKISLVFQDPLSALNPIMKVGKQICEALRNSQNMSAAEAKEKAQRNRSRAQRRSPGPLPPSRPLPRGSMRSCPPGSVPRDGDGRWIFARPSARGWRPAAASTGSSTRKSPAAAGIWCCCATYPGL